jgi:hypothetical protein
MKVRLHRTRQECEQATERLAEAFDVLAVSQAYPDRGASRLVRVYLESRLPNLPSTGRDGG